MSYKDDYNNNRPNNYNRSQSMGMNQPPRYNNNNNNNNNQQLDNFFRFNDGFQMDNFDTFDEDPFSFGFFGNRHNNNNPNQNYNNPISNHINSMLNQMQNMEKEMFNQIDNNFGNQISTFQDNNGNGSQQAVNIRTGGANPGTFISKSYVQKVNYSQGGEPIKEVYQSQSINQRGTDGHNISEKQEAYKNSKTGVEKAAHQRVLDGRGAKLIKQRNRFTGEQEEHNIFKGMNENELDSFNQNYNDYRNKSNFQKNYEYLNRLNPRQIASGNNYGSNYNNRLPGNNRIQRPPQGYLPDNNYNQNMNNNYNNNNVYTPNNNYNRNNSYNPNNNYNRNGY